MGKRAIWIVLVMAFVVMAAGCSGSGDDSDNTASSGPVLTGEELVAAAVNDWLGVDYAFHDQDSGTTAPDGTIDADGDGEVDANDAVVFIETLKTLGYQIPETTIIGLYANEYTPAGYTYTDAYVPTSFSYSLDSPVSQTDLKAHDWSGLEAGDMIFIDIDGNFLWDFCALYIGPYADGSVSYTHAVIVAYDSPDEVVIYDLDDGASDLRIDIDFAASRCDVRKPDFDNFADYYAP